MMIRTAYVRVIAVAILPFSESVWQIAHFPVAQSLNLPAELAALPETIPAHQTRSPY